MSVFCSIHNTWKYLSNFDISVCCLFQDLCESIAINTLAVVLELLKKYIDLFGCIVGLVAL